MKILIVDDLPIKAKDISNALADTGIVKEADIRVWSYGIDAFNEAVSENIDLIISDIHNKWIEGGRNFRD